MIQLLVVDAVPHLSKHLRHELILQLVGIQILLWSAESILVRHGLLMELLASFVHQRWSEDDASKTKPKKMRRRKFVLFSQIKILYPIITCE